MSDEAQEYLWLQRKVAALELAKARGNKVARYPQGGTPYESLTGMLEYTHNYFIWLTTSQIHWHL